MKRDAMEFDIVIVGGGPAGLAAAIRLKQLASNGKREVTVCVVEKAAEMGAHILSGAVMDPRALTELLPNWKELGAPVITKVTEDRMLFLSETGAYKIPQFMLPTCLINDGNYIIRLGNLVKWLAEQAEAMGVEMFPGFAGASVMIDSHHRVKGVVTGDMGLTRDGQPSVNFQPGVELHAKYTLFAEGCRGHLSKQLEASLNLRQGINPQTFGIGIKELWEVPDAHHQSGLVVHSADWPMNAGTYGGGFVYHLDENLISVGYVMGLDYKNPYLSPYEEFQRYKTHAAIRMFLEGGRRIGYGARAITSGGLQSLPKLVFQGGALLGDAAGFLNAGRIKGSHAAIKSGILAAEAAYAAVAAGRAQDELFAYPEAFKQSWLYTELHQTRNFKPYMKKGLWLGSCMFGIEQKLFNGNVPWTLANSADHTALMPAAKCEQMTYPKHDGQLTFDRLTSISLCNIQYAVNQPNHLRLNDDSLPIKVNLALYDSPEQRYCPAGVYEIVRGDSGVEQLQINAQNCIQCKTCDIKDPLQNIEWTPPQGGDGPLYVGM
jgi:electron-transferring-flavoprotein dehydrogenase